MKAICVLGNSHVRPLRQLVEDRRVRLVGGGSFTFFVCHVSLLQGIEVAGRQLLPRSDELAKLFDSSSRGRSFIAIDEFDEFVIMGHGFAIHRLVYLAERYRSDGLLGPRNRRYLLSDDCYSACAMQQLARGEAMRIARLIRTVSDKPVTIVAEPNLGEGLPPSDIPWWLRPHYQAVEDGEADAMNQLFRGVCRALEVAHSIRIVPPLPEIAANGLFNRREFCMLTEVAPDAGPPDRVNAILHGNKASGASLVRLLYGNDACLDS